VDESSWKIDQVLQSDPLRFLSFTEAAYHACVSGTLLGTNLWTPSELLDLNSSFL
jgi:hypothetical protein